MGKNSPVHLPNKYQLNKMLGIEYRQSNTGESFTDWLKKNGHTKKVGRPKKTDN